MTTKIQFASLFSLLVLLGCSTPSKPQAGLPGSAAPTGPSLPCSQNPERQKARSLELQTIVNADQAERADFQKKSMDDLMTMVRRDEERRKRVGEIFGEGCFETAEDYGAAALVFQHGDLPDHFFQTYLWSKRAVELGDKSKMNLMALGIDRYLVKVVTNSFLEARPSRWR